MRLYAGSSKQFIQDAIQNQIADKLKSAFFNYYRYNPSHEETNSWRNSLRAISQVFQYTNLLDHGVLLEYQLPLTSKRLDCLICGKDEKQTDNAVIIELKQWEKCEEASGENEVLTWVGGAKREVLHPSAQVRQYQYYLEDSHTAFYEGDRPVVLNACAYLHNYNHSPHDVLFSDRFSKTLATCPVFTADDVDNIRDYLSGKFQGGEGLDVLRRIEESRFRPCKKLMEHVGSVIKGKSEYILLDEQLVVYDAVVAAAKKGFHDRRKAAIIIKGGPGTGKSVIAINLMADLLLKEYNAHYATGSRAFTTTLRKIIGTRGSVQFKYFNSYAEAEPGSIDVLISDEAHRIRKTSNSRFTPRHKRSDLPQIEELLKAAKVAVFLIDDDQVVRPDEIGSVDYIKRAAASHGAVVSEYELEAQFRCNGSDAFVNWINNTLGIKRTANVIWDQHEEFDFKIFPSPHELERAIRQKVQEGHTGRVTAGFCWDWSDAKPDGTLIEDVVIGDYKRPWDARPEATKLAPGIPKASLWAYDPNGIDQVGCVYTAQGFEFDYVGVIFGPDLTYNFDEQCWEGRPEKSSDSVVKRGKGRFADLVKNTYRVLLSRGMKGCYVHFMDKDTERFFKSRIEGEALVQETPLAPIEIVPIEKADPYVTHLPAYSLKAAAGRFGKGQEVEELGWVRVNNRKLERDMFIAQVAGHSMEPKIPDGSYCLFRANPAGSRQGKIVLALQKHIEDFETGGPYTVKRYRSEKSADPTGDWKPTKIVLEPLNPEFEPIPIPNTDDDPVQIIAEFLEVLR